MYMKPSLTILLAAIGISMAACSSDHDKSSPTPEPGNRKAIAFDASAPKAPRTPTTTQNLEFFKVWGFVDGVTFMEDVDVTKTDGNWEYSPTMFWPADNKPVNFYSYSPKIKTILPNNENNPDIPGFINFGSTDLLYGVNIGETAGDGPTASQVHINFRHALSQIRFTLKRKSEAGHPALKVDVTKVQLVNILSVGSFHFPDSSTISTSETVGEWVDQTKIDNTIEGPDPGNRDLDNPVIYTGSAVTLTDTPKELLSTNYIFAIPQTLSKTGMNGSKRVGSYVKVLCAIYDEKSQIRLWPSTDTPEYDPETGCAYLYFPLDNGHNGESKWDMGRAYVYHLSIGVPDKTSAIQFDITVDEYGNFQGSDLTTPE